MHRVEFVAFGALRLLSRALPERASSHLGGLLGWAAGVLLRIRRRDVDRHLAWAFPDRPKAWRRAIAIASYRHLGREAFAIFRLGGWSPERIVERTRLVGFEALGDAAEGSDGVVLLTGHLGNWEIGGAALAARGFPIDVVAKGMANRRFERELFSARERLGMNVVEMGDAPKGVLRSLRAGRVAAMLGDQNTHRNGIFVPFFGRMAATARGPALFALRARAPVFIAFALRDPGSDYRYSVVFEPFDFEPSGDQEQDIVAFMAAYTAVVERAVRDAPDQYFWQHRRWKTRPPEEPTSGQPVMRG